MTKWCSVTSDLSLQITTLNNKGVHMNLVYEVVEFSAFESKIQKVNLINN